jgi:hypothetical protein
MTGPLDRAGAARQAVRLMFFGTGGFWQVLKYHASDEAGGTSPDGVSPEDGLPRPSYAS